MGLGPESGVRSPVSGVRLLRRVQGNPVTVTVTDSVTVSDSVTVTVSDSATVPVRMRWSAEAVHLRGFIARQVIARIRSRLSRMRCAFAALSAPVCFRIASPVEASIAEPYAIRK